MASQSDGVIDPWALVALLGCAQGLLLVLALGSTRRGGDPTRRALTGLLLVGALAGCSIALAHSGLVESVILLTLFEYAVTLTAGPLLLRFVRLSVGRPSSRHWLHLIPALAWTLWVCLQTVDIQLGGGSLLPLFLPPIHWLLLHQMTYTAIALYAYVRSDGAEANRRAFIAPGPVLLLFLSLHAVQLTRFSFATVPELQNVVPLAMTIAFVALTFALVRHSGFGSPPALTRPRYAGSTLRPGQAVEIERRLVEILGTERAFLDSGLTVARLAARLHVSQSHLSQVVNQRLGRSFAELVADYRVEEAKRILTDPQTTDLTVETIGNRSGFLSRSAFYEAFKRQTGETPSAYRRQKRPRS